MSERRRGLGRGLGALIPAAPVSEDRPPVAPPRDEATEAVNTVGTVEARTGAAVSPGAIPPVLPRGRGAIPARPVSVPEPGSAPDSFPVPGAPAVRGTVAEIAAAAGRDAGTGVSAPADPLAGTVDGAHFAELPLDTIAPNPRQPREVFDEDALAELVTSIKEVGLLQPVVVRRLESGRYELIMGERRLRACREAGLTAIPAIVRSTEDDRLLLDALLENLHRAQLNPLEEAAAYDQLLRDFKCTHDELADRIGRSRPQVSNTLRLLRLSPAVQRRVAAGVLSAGHARALLSVDDAEEQDRLAYRIVAEGLSVRAIEEIVTLRARENGKPAKSRGPRPGRLISPALENLAGRLSDRFETRVKVDLGQKKGKIVVEFASLEDLERILGQLAPGENETLEAQLSAGPTEGAEDDGENVRQR
ncbi:ParB/RepB/Spo0J family partition protein [Streptomyces sp. ST2-7A]|uniref:ParB/RepB/Spo0J family partition protein n=1 Tax=Streptomyces sp. ST2-7A TaxID=2907214 RepID=UPI001F3DAF96|nr:ParB/RepB/Spo0J family partition protein [Streptomyces sp. ST2-7A]MCE7081503.1 ParB/RepB/Spo0J family partition protein [Streptomyces sp. ST2-7A]